MDGRKGRSSAVSAHLKLCKGAHVKRIAGQKLAECSSLCGVVSGQLEHPGANSRHRA